MTDRITFTGSNTLIEMIKDTIKAKINVMMMAIMTTPLKWFVFFPDTVLSVLLKYIKNHDGMTVLQKQSFYHPMCNERGGFILK